MQGNLNRNQSPAAGIADHAEARLVAVENLEPLLHIFHADAGAGAAQRESGRTPMPTPSSATSMSTRSPSRRLRR
jgi:hypothetical protein